jgi:uncharacterized protein (DUF2141 family)
VRHRRRAVRALIAAAPLLVAATLPATALPESADVSVTVTGVRSARGLVIACLTARADAFPDCSHDPQARSLKVRAASVVQLDFGQVPAGRYAISLFHDENGNGKLDKRLVIPREGYGFSRDAPVMMGPPSFARAAFAVGRDGQRQAIRMRYIF